MSSAAERLASPFSPLEQLREGRRIVRTEADALSALSETLEAGFCQAADRIFRCRGSIVVTGMGKAGLIGRKVSATLSSTGTPSHFLHPGEAVHGDAGSLRCDDVVLALSNSGESEEIGRLIAILNGLQIPLLSITSSRESTLARHSDVALVYGRCREADPLGLAPTVSTSVMLALGDALALVVAQMRGLTAEQFAVFHPGGSLGQQLRTVRETMRGLDQIRIAPETATIRDVFRKVNSCGRRTGAVILTGTGGELSGLFTDSDLARLFTQFTNPPLDDPVSTVMTRLPQVISPDVLLRDAIWLMTEHKLSELPVIDGSRRPVGLLDITDVIALVPQDPDEPPAASIRIRE